MITSAVAPSCASTTSRCLKTFANTWWKLHTGWPLFNRAKIIILRRFIFFCHQRFGIPPARLNSGHPVDMSANIKKGSYSKGWSLHKRAFVSGPFRKESYCWSVKKALLWTEWIGSQKQLFFLNRPNRFAQAGSLKRPPFMLFFIRLFWSDHPLLLCWPIWYDVLCWPMCCVDYYYY